MWVLESSGDFLRGKRMWLKPGKKYLFGRVKREGVCFAIDHKTVSRQHFVISVDLVKDEDVGNVYARSKITIEDLASKAGTNIDGELISHSSKVLKKDVTSIRPGSCPDELVIRWVPFVLTYGLGKKDVKSGLLKTKQERVRELDLKVVNDYLPGQTTHVITQKRNTAKALQALIEGKHLVTDAYIDALIYSSTPTDLETDESFCHFENDFDEAWPSEAQYLTPVGKEPTSRPDEAYFPDPSRTKVFEKYTFFIFDQSQYDTLLSPITLGHGKALFFDPKNASTMVEHGLKFISGAIGSSQRAIVIRLNETDESWRSNHIEKICLKLGQQSATQSDLLEAVLANDASLLQGISRQSTLNDEASSVFPSGPSRGQRNVAQQSSVLSKGIESQAPLQPIAPVSPVSESANGSELAKSQSQPPNSQQPDTNTNDEVSRPRKKARFAPVLQPLKAFDDDFDPGAIVPFEEIEEEAEDFPSTGPQSRNRTTNNAADDFVLQTVKEEPTSITQRRSLSLVDESNDDMDELLSGAATLRKDKEEAEARARRTGKPLQPLRPGHDFKAPKLVKEAKMIDVREVSRAKRDADAAKAKKEREELAAMQAEDEGMTGPQNLVKVVSFELVVRDRGGSSTHAYRGETWKPEWASRKNFKGFRRVRDGLATAPVRQKIMVPTVPWNRDKFDISQRPELVENARTKPQNKWGKQLALHATAARSAGGQTIHDSSDSDTSVRHGDEADAKYVGPETARLQREAEAVIEHPVDVDAPRQTRHSDNQTQRSEMSPAKTKDIRASKRPASSTPNGRSAKKQKTAPVVVVDDSDIDGRNDNNDNDDSDDSDDMRFEFGTSKRLREARSAV